jgi:hypothetical protein
MANKGKAKFDSKSIENEDEEFHKYLNSLEDRTLENEPAQEYTLVGLRLIYPANVQYDGLVTGKRYEWSQAGSVIMVNEPDVEHLLNKRLGGGSCCGGVNSDGNRLFELA